MKINPAQSPQENKPQVKNETTKAKNFKEELKPILAQKTLWLNKMEDLEKQLTQTPKEKEDIQKAIKIAMVLPRTELIVLNLDALEIEFKHTKIKNKDLFKETRRMINDLIASFSEPISPKGETFGEISKKNKTLAFFTPERKIAIFKKLFASVDVYKHVQWGIYSQSHVEVLYEYTMLLHQFMDYERVFKFDIKDVFYAQDMELLKMLREKLNITCDQFMEKYAAVKAIDLVKFALRVLELLEGLHNLSNEKEEAAHIKTKMEKIKQRMAQEKKKAGK